MSTVSDAADRPDHLVQLDRVAQQSALPAPVRHRLEQLLLVALPVEVAAGQVVALPGVVQRLGAVHLLAADGEDRLVWIERTSVSTHISHAAEQVDDLAEAGEVDQRGAVEPDAGEPGQGGREQLGAALAAAAVLERGVDLVVAAGEAVPRGRDLDQQVARDGDQVRLLAARPGRGRSGWCRSAGPAAGRRAQVGADQQVVERPVQVGALGAGVGVEQLLLGHRAVVPVG